MVRLVQLRVANSPKDVDSRGEDGESAVGGARRGAPPLVIVSGFRFCVSEFFQRPANWDWLLYLDAAGTTSNFTRSSRRSTSATASGNATPPASSPDVRQLSCSCRGGAWLNQAVNYSLDDESLCAGQRSSGEPQRGGSRPLHMAATCTWVHTGHKQFN